MSSGDADQSSLSSCSRNGSRYVPDEETPLLQRTSRPSLVRDESERTSDLVEAAALPEGPGLEPGQRAKLSRVTSYSSGKIVVDDSDSDDDHLSIQPAEKKTPYLCGVSKKRFWIFYAGVLLQYFVRA